MPGDNFYADQAFASANALGVGASQLILGNNYGVNDTNGGKNYTITLANAFGTINPEAVTVTASTDTKTYDSTTNSSATPTVTNGQFYGVDGANLSEAYTTANAATGLTLTPTVAFTPIGSAAGASNYTITSVNNTTGVINPEAVTVTASTNTKTYDSTTSASATPTVTSGQFYNVDGANFNEAYTTANAATGLTLTPTVAFTPISPAAGASNYTITLINNTIGVISPEAVTVTASTNTKTYDSTTSASATPTVTSGQFYNVDGASLSESYTTANAGTGLTLAPIATFTPIGLAAGSSNYAISYVNNTTGVINPAALFASIIGDPSKVYNGTTTASLTSSNYDLSGFIGTQGATVNQKTGTYNSPNVIGATTVTATLAAKNFVANGGTLLSNYTLPISASGAGTITPATVTLAGSKTYDTTGAFAANNFGIGGTILTGVGLQTLTLSGNGSVASANVSAGTQQLTSSFTLQSTSGFFAGLASNYQIATSGNSGKITPATISIAGTKIYDGNTTFAAADFGAVNGLGGQTLTLSGNGSVASANVSAGKQLLLNGSLALGDGTNGGLGSNYKLSLLGDTGKITPATLTYVANTVGQSYGTAIPALNGSVTGFVKGQNVGNATTGSLVFNTNATQSSNVGSYYIDGSGLTAKNGNYVFVQAPGNATAFTITPALLTVTADPQTMVYGGSSLPNLTDTITGYVLGQNLGTSGVTGTAAMGTTATAYNGTAGSGSNAGNYVITAAPGTLAASNYTFQYVNGTLVVTPAALTVSADPQTKVYGSVDPTLTYAVSGLQNGDTSNLVLAGGLTRDPGEHVANGPYAITQGTLDSNSNYALTYTGNLLTVTPASLSVVADNQSKGLGTINPTLTYTFGALQNGDTSGVFTGGLTTTALLDSLPGTYPINQGSLSAGTDYAINYTAGALTIESPLSTLNTALLRALLHGNGKSINGTLLSILNGNPAGGLANLAPAAGGNGPIDLANLSPSAGGPNGGVGGTITALIQCDESSPCELAQ